MPAKLRNPFHIYFFFAFLVAALTSCSSNNNDQNSNSVQPLLGNWRIMTIHNAQSSHLDSVQMAVYMEEIKQLIDSSYLNLSKDSLYKMRIGPESESGIWLVTDKLDKLVLKSKTHGISRYNILSVDKNQMILLNIDEPDSVRLELRR